MADQISFTVRIDRELRDNFAATVIKQKPRKTIRQIIPEMLREWIKKHSK